MRNYLIIFLSALLAFSCGKKGEEFTDYDLIDLPIAEEARCIEIYGDTILVGGGATNGKGYLLQGDASTFDFDIVKSNFKHEVYSLAQHGTRWYVGCDSVVLYHGDSLHKLNRYWWQEPDWVSDLSKHPIWNISEGKGLLAMVAGGKLAFGTVYMSTDSAKSWGPVEPENELRAVYALPSGEVAWFGGNGYFKQRGRDETLWTDFGIEDEFIIDLFFESDAIGWGLTRSGKILHFTRGGREAPAEKAKGKSTFMNHFDFEGMDAIAVGEQGEMLVSKDGGENWSRHQLDSKVDLNDVQILNGEALIVGEGGVLIRIQLSSFQ